MSGGDSWLFLSIFLCLPLPSPTLSATSDFSRVRTAAVGSRKDTGAQRALAGSIGECSQCPGTQVPTLSHIGHFPSGSSECPLEATSAQSPVS